MRNWWERPDIIGQVAVWAEDCDELDSVAEIDRFYEKPYDYPELFAAWAAEQGCPEGEEDRWLAERDRGAGHRFDL